MLSMKSVVPVRLLHNAFAAEVQTAEKSGASSEALQKILGRGRAKKGMFEGDMHQGELEIGQVSAIIDNIQPATDIVSNLSTSTE